MQSILQQSTIIQHDVKFENTISETVRHAVLQFGESTICLHKNRAGSHKAEVYSSSEKLLRELIESIHFSSFQYNTYRVNISKILICLELSRNIKHVRINELNDECISSPDQYHSCSK